MRARLGWKMRAMAWLAAIPTALLPLVSGPAEAQQKKQYLKAMERPLRSELAAGKTDKLTAAQWKKVDEKRAKEAANRPDERPLSNKEMASLRGRGPYRNKYFAGTLPWHRSIHDVNMCNGNLFKSFTDIQVAPAKGAGLAMQRTYNSQNQGIFDFGFWIFDEDPFCGDRHIRSLRASASSTLLLQARLQGSSGGDHHRRKFVGLFRQSRYVRSRYHSRFCQQFQPISTLIRLLFDKSKFGDHIG